MVAKRILLVDDDNDLRESLAEELIATGEFAVDQASHANQGLEMAISQPYDMMIFDVSMPDMNGCDLCRAVRAKDVPVPIIMLTGANSNAEIVEGLDAGANDYVTKPFSLDVLLARMRVHLSQFEKTDQAIFIIGPYDFLPAARQLTGRADGIKIRLTDKETAILKHLYRLGGAPASRESLLDEVWGYNPAVTTHTLETHIYRLRQKIEPDTSNAQILLTTDGGYRLCISDNDS